nr:uncharacterized protein LOC111986517 [Quercus suber]
MFREIQEKISKQVLGWKEKFISKAGWEVLIKTVAQAIPTYSMSLFRLPKSICDSINSLLARYWWGQNHEERKIHWINWTKLCTHKHKGGMGFRDLSAFNLAMLAKQVWRLIHNTHSLFHRVYKAWYFPRGSFLTAELGPNPSFVWRSLLAARDIIIEGSRWQVGDGYEDTRQWDRGKVFATFAQRTCEEILEMPLSNVNSRDVLVWQENKAKKFTVRTAYRIAVRMKNPSYEEHSLAQRHGPTWGKI